MAARSSAASSSSSISAASSASLSSWLMSLLLLLLSLSLFLSTMMTTVQGQYHPGLVSTQLLYQPINGISGGGHYGGGYGYGYGSGGYNAGGGGTRHGQGFVGNPGIGITQSSATLANVYTPRMAAMGLLPAVSNLYGGGGGGGGLVSPQSQYGSSMMLMPPTTPLYSASSMYAPQPSGHLQYAGAAYPGVATSTSYFHRYMAKR